MGRLVYTGLGSLSLVAHVLQIPPPHANSFVLGPAVINKHRHLPLSTCGIQLPSWRHEGDNNIPIPLSSEPPRSPATLEGLCALPCSLASPVTRVVDGAGHMLVEKFVTVQMAPVDLVQEVKHTMTGMVLTMQW